LKVEKAGETAIVALGETIVALLVILGEVETVQVVNVSQFELDLGLD